MIFNRTAEDVSSAIKIVNEKAKNGIALTDEEKEIVERGMLTINVINRIESKEDEIRQIINNMGYYTAPYSNKQWTDKEIFELKDYARIINICYHMAFDFFVFPSTPINISSDANYNYDVLNNMEEILVDIERMTEEVKSRYRYCGEFNCGE